MTTITIAEAASLTGLSKAYLSQLVRYAGYAAEMGRSLPRSFPVRVEKPRGRWLLNAEDFEAWRASIGQRNKGRCGACKWWRHPRWVINTDWFDPDRATCTWASGSGVEIGERRAGAGRQWVDDLPPVRPQWLTESYLQTSRRADQGKGCKAFDPATNTTP